MSNPTPLLTAGRTVHLLRGSKYAGAWTLASVEAHDAEWFAITDTRGRQWFARESDTFATEAAAKAEATARRAPRKPKAARPLYGDFAQLASFSGIRTDGTGRKAMAR